MILILMKTVSYLMTAILLCIEGICDLKKREINLVIPAIFGVIGILMFCLSKDKNWIMFLGGAAEGLFVLVVSVITREGIGLGDALLLICTGILLGAENNLIMFLWACVFCSIISGILILCKKAGRKTRIPFVPFLIPGYLVMLLRGL